MNRTVSFGIRVVGIISISAMRETSVSRVCVDHACHEARVLFPFAAVKLFATQEFHYWFTGQFSIVTAQWSAESVRPLVEYIANYPPKYECFIALTLDSKAKERFESLKLENEFWGGFEILSYQVNLSFYQFQRQVRTFCHSLRWVFYGCSTSHVAVNRYDQRIFKVFQIEKILNRLRIESATSSIVLLCSSPTCRPT